MPDGLRSGSSHRVHRLLKLRHTTGHPHRREDRRPTWRDRHFLSRPGYWVLKVTGWATDYPHAEGFLDVANMIKCMRLSLQTLAKVLAGGATRCYGLQ